ncbi:unnamed protein product, partial [Pleuronectes platessa]
MAISRRPVEQGGGLPATVTGCGVTDDLSEEDELSLPITNIKLGNRTRGVNDEGGEEERRGEVGVCRRIVVMLSPPAHLLLPLRAVPPPVSPPTTSVVKCAKPAEAHPPNASPHPRPCGSRFGGRGNPVGCRLVFAASCSSPKQEFSLLIYP